MSIKNRVLWSTYYRFKSMSCIEGFNADILSYATKSSQISEYVNLIGKATVIDSKIGRFTRVNNAVVFNASVGAFCGIAARAIIGFGGEHPLDQVSCHSIFYMSSNKKHPHLRFTQIDKFDDSAQKVTIGNDVWIGNDARVKQGIAIGDGAMIAAGAVVVKDVPAYAIVGGVPARILKYRHTKELRETLIESKWWDWPVESLQIISDEFDSSIPLTLEKFNYILQCKQLIEN